MAKYRKLELVYSNAPAKVSVWKCQNEDTNELVALKEQGFKSSEQAGNALREYRLQRSLIHQNICKIFAFSQEQRDSLTFNVLVVEWMDKQDVFKDITNRGTNSFPWREEELWIFFRGLIDALAYAQIENISHRDIKPQNLFLNSRNEIKIGDFGSAKENTSATHTLVGTPYFLSPLLRAAFLAGTANRKVDHNPFKSDVYSLGVTFLFMCMLQPPIAMAGDVSEERIACAISSINYSDTVKSLLGWMVTTQEENRPDFLQLNSWLNPTSQYVTQTSETAIEWKTCPTCFLVFPFTSVPWQSALDGYLQYCSINCYTIMKDAAEASEREGVLCSWCRKWYFDPWLFDCKSHGVCSQRCGKAVLLNTSKFFKEQLRCPECGMAIGEETINSLFEGKLQNKIAKYQEKKCDSCDDLADRHYFHCKHNFCSRCFYRNTSNKSFNFCPLDSEAPYITPFGPSQSSSSEALITPNLYTD